ncbi:hypothetical protein AOLI_G00253160 [Acnodon oligacanthus]
MRQIVTITDQSSIQLSHQVCKTDVPLSLINLTQHFPVISSAADSFSLAENLFRETRAQRRGIGTAARCEDRGRKSRARCSLPVRFALQCVMDPEATPPGLQTPPPAPLRTCSESATAEH